MNPETAAYLRKGLEIVENNFQVILIFSSFAAAGLLGMAKNTVNRGHSFAGKDLSQTGLGDEKEVNTLVGQDLISTFDGHITADQAWYIRVWQNRKSG